MTHHTHAPSWPLPATTAAHCYDWISAETVISLALQAYYAHCRELDHLPDDPGGHDMTFNNGRECFAEDLAEDFRLRVEAHGEKMRIPIAVFPAERGAYPYPSTAPRWHAQAQLAVRHGPRSPDDAPPVSARPRPESGTERGIHCALSKTAAEDRTKSRKHGTLPGAPPASSALHVGSSVPNGSR